MEINFMIAFIIPWLLATMLVLKHLEIILRIAPLGSALGFIFNDIGMHWGYWRVTPIYADEASFSTLPFNMGVYPVMASFMVYLIEKRRWSSLLALLTFTVVTTVAELGAVWLGKVFYGAGWNVIFTFFSYFAAYLLVYVYAKISMKTT